LAGVTSQRVATERIEQHVLFCGDQRKPPVFFIHGNFSAATYYQELMQALSGEFYCIAPDLRGYGETEHKLIDARRGARDWADDLQALMRALAVPHAHFIGWSAGAAPIMQLAIDACEAVQSLTLVAPESPFGYGGSKDEKGTPTFEDFAGSGGGIVSEAFIERIKQQDTSSDHADSPRNIIRQSYYANPLVHPREDELLAASLQQAIGEQDYPGDWRESPNWPYRSPGDFGAINAISARHYRLDRFAFIEEKPPVLWVRGDVDCIISDTSMSDPGYLGQMGLMPGWPGSEVYPPQPMVSQMRYVLDAYAELGGIYREKVMAGVGHSPFIERPREFEKLYMAFLNSV
jgi:pimeloyl-ACP methyl ester carboxylesterase